MINDDCINNYISQGGEILSYDFVDIENADFQPFINKTTSGKLNPWSCATDKEVA